MAPIVVPGEDGRPGAAMFALAYIADGRAGADRPVTFVFDGGPGSGGAALAMAMGPRRLVATGVGAPPRLADNPATLLRASDLVFVDPVDTGYSRVLPGGSAADFLGVRQDARACADFVSRWLAAHGRGGAPIYLAGRSYGGLRVVAIAERMVAAGSDGHRLAGLMLLSPAIADFLGRAGDPRFVSSLPTLVAVAAAHGRGSAAGKPVDAVVALADRFARGPYRAALAAGDRLDAGTRRQVVSRLAALTGLDPAAIAAANLRITSQAMIDGLLAPEAQRLGTLDGRASGPVAQFAGQGPPFSDPSNSARILGYDSGAAYAGYLRSIGVAEDGRYVGLSLDVNRAWDWRLPTGFEEGAVAPLRVLLAARPRLRLLVTAGYYDLTLPFGVARDRLAAGGLIPGRWAMRLYRAGHFVTDDPAARVTEANDLAAFIARAPDAASGVAPHPSL